MALRHLKFIDEMGVNLALTRRYGRAAPSVQVVDSVQQNYGEHVSLLAALDVGGLSAPYDRRRRGDAEVCRAYVAQV